ncbi:MAG: hypothetical protein KG012_03785 [Deltaproteobacteria bacterium]|nr:hypothetical protein [Deltaproteobacteria bacterium]
MRRKITWLALFFVVCSLGCATTRNQAGDDLKEVEGGLEATYWTLYSAGKSLDIPKLASGGPAPVMAFETGLKAVIISLALLIKLGKAGKGKGSVTDPGNDNNLPEGQ